jgi:hypothetical protein
MGVRRGNDMFFQQELFKDEGSLGVLYENIIKTAMHTVTAEDIANFLGKRFSVLFEGEAGSRYNKKTSTVFSRLLPCSRTRLTGIWDLYRRLTIPATG